LGNGGSGVGLRYAALLRWTTIGTSFAPYSSRALRSRRPSVVCDERL
jgi:hypothetical protein